MDIAEAREKFKLLRKDAWRIQVTQHAWKEHPNRRFNPAEIRDLVMYAIGGVHVNNRPSAQPGSFLFICSDSNRKRCDLAFHIRAIGGNEFIIVVSAYR